MEKIKLFSSVLPEKRSEMRKNSVAYSNLHFNKKNLIEQIENEMDLNVEI